MPQTLLALLALAMTGLLTFSQQRTTIQSYEVRLRDEYSVTGSGVLMHVMELIAARSFDEASTPHRIRVRGALPEVSDFTLPTGFGILEAKPGNGQGLAIGQNQPNQSGGTVRCDLMSLSAKPNCDDIDDLHGIVRAPVEVAVSDEHSLRFEVSVRVAYVDEYDPTIEVTYPTHNKLVVLTAYVPDRPHLGALVTLERVISYDPVKADDEHEYVHGPLLD